MKRFFRGFAWLLPLMLTACFHKAHRVQNPPVAPPIEQTTQPPALPQPTPAETTPPAETMPPPAPAPQPPEQPAKPPVHHKRHVSKPVQEAAAEPAAVSAIGDLSSGDPAGLLQETQDSIASTERGLKGIHRQLSTQEQKTAAQVAEFLKQAKTALASGDVDGAHTLALKARVLLGELSR